MCDASQLPPDRLVPSIRSVVIQPGGDEGSFLVTYTASQRLEMQHRNAPRVSVVLGFFKLVMTAQSSANHTSTVASVKIVGL